MFEPIEGRFAEPPRVGLLPALGGGSVVGMGPWAGGVTWAPEQCGEGGAYDASSCPPDDPDIDIPGSPDIVEAMPFTVWAGDRCSPWDLDRPWAERARRQLAAVQSHLVAAEFWTGEIAQASDWPNRFLASPDSDVLTAGAEEPLQALACLELGIARAGKGRRGMIHATPDLVTTWQAGGALRREGGVILTVLDTVVIADAGYDGSGPNGELAADGSVWAYGTEMIGVRLSPVRMVPDVEGITSANIDRSVNTVLARAERDAVVLWDGCVHVAVEVDLALCGIGGS